ncbi:hypothetical protein BLS_007761 [Venturia inaequalis]|uniref:Uncharacterized protein n=1 Tax=Venturia inaequalis TaxID=5025 RepID=A0A8H3U8D2_VENIN|nr:hypothetical protein BLS_007761 [Venturia inaequalis]
MRVSSIVFGLFTSFAMAAPLASYNGGSDTTGTLAPVVGSNLGSVVGTGSGNKASADGNSATGNGNGNGDGNAAGNVGMIPLVLFFSINTHAPPSNGNEASANGNTIGNDIGNVNVGLPSTITINPTIDAPITS